jgi:hypothetical protein
LIVFLWPFLSSAPLFQPCVVFLRLIFHFSRFPTFCLSFVAPFHLWTGLPDFSWYMIPKPDKNIPKGHKISQMFANI